MAVQDIIENIKSWPLGKKAVLSVTMVIALASFILLVVWMQRPDYQVLFTNLSQEDAGLVVEKLKAMRVPYRSTPTGVMVPADRVYDLRLELAAQGLPRGGGVGFEIFDNTGISTTEFVQKINYRRALQGELGRTIMSISAIADCRVHLTIPERSIFSNDDSRPKASVLVKLRGGRNLSREQVNGIVHLVASSVAGLDPGDVTVVNQNGEVLTRKDDPAVMMSSSQFEYQRQIEKDMEKRIVGILEPVVGPGRVKVSASAQIDFTRVERTEESYNPDEQVVRSEHRQTEQKTASGTSGVPGTSSNLPSSGRTVSGGNMANSRSQTETINYEISKTVSHIINPTGEIKRISIAVLVDGTYEKNEDTGEVVYRPRSTEELKNYEEIVKRAIGFSMKRGDEVKVVNMPFRSVDMPDVEDADVDYVRLAVTALRYAAPLLALILLFLFVFRPLMRILAAPPKVRQPQMALPQTVAEIEESMQIAHHGTKPSAIEWAARNPKDAADVIRGWIEGER